MKDPIVTPVLSSPDDGLSIQKVAFNIEWLMHQPILRDSSLWELAGRLAAEQAGVEHFVGHTVKQDTRVRDVLIVTLKLE